MKDAKSILEAWMSAGGAEASAADRQESISLSYTRLVLAGYLETMADPETGEAMFSFTTLGLTARMGDWLEVMEGKSDV